MVWNFITTAIVVWVAVMLLGILAPLITLANLVFYYRAKTKDKVLYALLIVFVPFGWIIYWLIRKKR
jgi:hypothetical protein